MTALDPSASSPDDASGIDPRIRAMFEAYQGPSDPNPRPDQRRQLRSPRRLMLVAAVLVLVPLGIAQASGTFDDPRAVDPIPPSGTLPYGPATIAIANLTRAYFDCMVGQGAQLRREDRDTVVLDNDTPAMDNACSQQHAAVMAAQNTAAARDERSARTPLIQEWDACATAARAAGTTTDLQTLLDACETNVLKAHGQTAAAARIQQIITPGTP